MTEDPLRLEAGSWYAWHMFPGYGDPFVPYVSPIRFDAVLPRKTGRSILQLRFYNAGYASGVRDIDLDVRVLAERRHHLVIELLYGAHDPGRHAVIGQVGREWLEAYVHPRSGVEFPLYDRLDQRTVDQYLNQVMRMSPASA